jgi:hypothetical protein
VLLVIRHKVRALGELWKRLLPHLEGLPEGTRPKDFKLGNSNALLFLIVNNRPSELYSTTLDDHVSLNLIAHEANLSEVKVTAEIAQSWSTSVAKSAMCTRP